MYFIIFSFSEPDVNFQSSDGKWADNEVNFKGRDFEAIQFYFQKYKSNCNVPEVYLQRTTKKPFAVKIIDSIRGVESEKWEVPYSEPNSNLEGKSYAVPSCYGG